MPVESELLGGGTNVYRIVLKKGEFLRVVVEQEGINVALELVGPDGNPITTTYSLTGAWGLEPASMISGAPGAYEVQVKSLYPNAARGKYQVQVTDLRVPQPQDLTRIAAERKTTYAIQLYVRGDAESKKEAIEVGEDALQLWKAIDDNYEEGVLLENVGRVLDELGDRQGALDHYAQAIPLLRAVGDQDAEGITLNNIGLAYAALGEKQKALDNYEPALALYRAVGDRGGEAVTLNNIGIVYSARGEKQKALDYFEQSLPALHSLGDWAGEATGLNNIGATYDDLGEKQKALDNYEQALALYRAVGDREGEAATLSNIGKVSNDLGQKQKALDNYEPALALYRAVGDRGGEAVTLNNIGIVYSALGEKQKALDYYQQALPVLHAEGQRAAEATDLNNIGATYDDLGEKQKALDNYGQALALFRAVGDRGGEARTLTNIGEACNELGKKQEALDYFEQALPLLQAVGDRASEATDLNNIGATYDDLGEKQKALDNYQQALVLHRAVGDRDGESITLSNIGKVRNDLGQNQDALDNFSQALMLSREVKDPLREGVVLSNLMSYWKGEKQFSLAIFFGKKSIEQFQDIRHNIQGLQPEAQKSFLKSKSGVYRKLAELLIAEGRLPEAQQVLDLLKDQEYSDFIRQDTRGGAPALTAPTMTTDEETLDKKFQDISSRVTAIASEWASLRAKPSRTPEEDQHLADLDAQLKVANQEWNQFLDNIHGSLGQTEHSRTSENQLRHLVVGIQYILSQLDPGTVAIYTLVGDDQYTAIVVTPNTIVARQFPISPADLRAKVLDFKRELSASDGDPLPDARELYTILVGPIEQDLQGAKARTLLWSLDDVLRYIPMAALNDGQQYLVEKYQSVAFTPLNDSGLADRPVVTTWFGLGMGVSKKYGRFPALPSVPGELDSVIRTQGGPNGVVPGEILLDDNFTVERIKKALEQNPPLVHIASHFDLVPGNESQSFLLLGGSDSQGGHLSLADLRDDPAFDFSQTQLLALSACDTAVGDTAGDGHEVDGLGDVANSKGAKAVLASLWEVDDKSTGLLMRELYRLWTTTPGMTKAEALRRAQISLLHSNNSLYSAPYYWAPFILIGNPR